MKSLIAIAGGLVVLVSVQLLRPTETIYAQYASSAKPPPVITSQQAQNWLHEDWTGNASVYQRSERQIDSALAHGQNPKTLLQQNKSIAQHQPKDVMAQFRWGYSGWKMMNPNSGYWEKHLYLDNVFEALTSVPSPNTYEYARLRYLVAPHSSQMVKVGERILQSKQDDSDVKSHLVGDYVQLIGTVGSRQKGLMPQLKSRAITLAQQGIQSSPLNAKYHASLGSVYATSWVVSRSHDDAAKAIAAYQDYLRLAPPNDEFRPQVLAMLRDLQRT